MIVLFNGGRYIYSTGSDLPRYGPRIKSISTDTLIVTSVQIRADHFGSYDYTVIEFY